MLGGFRKTIVGGAALGLLAVGLSTGSTPVSAAAGDTCLVVEKPANVYNIEMFDKTETHGHIASNGTKQASKGSFTYKGRTMPRYGLYYPTSDPVVDHATPRSESFGGPSTIGNTPIQTGDHFLFSQAGECANNGIPFSSEGSAIGYCGRSVGLGVGKVNGNTVIIRWESVASQLVLLDRSATGSVNARPNPPNDSKGSCTDGTAITFSVDGPIVDTRA